MGPSQGQGSSSSRAQTGLRASSDRTEESPGAGGRTEESRGGCTAAGGAGWARCCSRRWCCTAHTPPHALAAGGSWRAPCDVGGAGGPQQARRGVGGGGGPQGGGCNVLAPP